VGEYTNLEMNNLARSMSQAKSEGPQGWEGETNPWVQSEKTLAIAVILSRRVGRAGDADLKK
jgi:hypothetical protein